MDLTHKSILVTGGSGFLGQYVVGRLHKLGCRNVAVPRSAEFDLTSGADVHRLIVKTQPQVVLHLAARVGGIGANRAQPGTFLYQNLMMGAQLIEACRQFRVEKLVVVGTICSYPKFTPVPFREEDLWKGYPEETNAPYGLAKKILGVQLQAYHQQFGMNGANLLLVNLYGPGDNFDLQTSHVIPALIRKCAEAQERGERGLNVWGTGTPTREFLYVDDAARAILLAAESVDTPEPINIGSGEEISVARLAEMIARRVGFRGEILYDSTMPDGQPRRSLDTTRARERLGFQSSVPLCAGLDRTIAWYLAQRRSTSGAAA